MKDFGDEAPASASAQVGVEFKSGDPGAAEAVRDRVRRTLRFRAYGLSGEDRQDLEQIVMAQLWEAVASPGFDPAGGFWGFVEVVVARRCIDWLRKRKDETPIDAEEDVLDPSRGPLATALGRERQDLAWAAIARLPESCRQLLRLHLEESRSYAEMARILGVAEGTLRVRMHRCIRKARRIVADLENPEKPAAGV